MKDETKGIVGGIEEMSNDDTSDIPKNVTEFDDGFCVEIVDGRLKSFWRDLETLDKNKYPNLTR